MKPLRCLAEVYARNWSYPGLVEGTLGAGPVRRYGCSQRWLGTSFETRRRSQNRIRT